MAWHRYNSPFLFSALRPHTAITVTFYLLLVSIFPFPFTRAPITAMTLHVNAPRRSVWCHNHSIRIRMLSIRPRHLPNSVYSLNIYTSTHAHTKYRIFVNCIGYTHQGNCDWINRAQKRSKHCVCNFMCATFVCCFLFVSCFHYSAYTRWAQRTTFFRHRRCRCCRCWRCCCFPRSFFFCHYGHLQPFRSTFTVSSFPSSFISIRATSSPLTPFPVHTHTHTQSTYAAHHKLHCPKNNRMSNDNERK